MSARKPMGKVRATIVVEWFVYPRGSVETAEDAAMRDQADYDAGRIDLEALMIFGDAVSCKFEAVRDHAADKALRTLCPQCGPYVEVDEDGCCTSCGCTAEGEGADMALAAIEAVKEGK